MKRSATLSSGNSLSLLSSGIKESYFEQLSSEEKDFVLRDVNGTENVIEEPEKFIEENIQELRHALDDIPAGEKNAYMQAISQAAAEDNEYVRSDRFLLMFLRAERYDIHKATKKLLGHFALKLEIFGLSKLCHRITQADLDEDDKKLLDCALKNFCAGVDHVGRMIVCVQRKIIRDRGLIQAKYVLNLQRAIFYQYMAVLEDCEEAQIRGFVLVCWNVGSIPPWNEYLTISSVGKMIHNDLPIRFAAIHNCYDDFKELLFITTRAVLSPKYILLRYNKHYGSVNECLNSLSSYGITIKSLPLNAQGEYQDEVFLEKLEERRKREEIFSDEVFLPKDFGEYDIKEPSPLFEPRYGECKGPKKKMSLKKSFIQRLDELMSKNNTALKDEANFDNDKDQNVCSKPSAKSEASQISEGKKSPECEGVKIDTQIIHNILGNKETTLDDTLEKCSIENESCKSTSSIEVKQEDNFDLNKSNIYQREKFPHRLMELLQNEKAKDCIWWISDGTAFAIERKKFTSDVLPKEFYGIKYESFLRTLRRWGFKRVQHKWPSPNLTAYCHPLFKKEAPHLIEKLSFDNKNESNNQDSAIQAKSVIGNNPLISQNGTRLGEIVNSSRRPPGNLLNQVTTEMQIKQYLIAQQISQQQKQSHQQQYSDLLQQRRQSLVNQSVKSLLNNDNSIHRGISLIGGSAQHHNQLLSVAADQIAQQQRHDLQQQQQQQQQMILTAEIAKAVASRRHQGVGLQNAVTPRDRILEGNIGAATLQLFSRNSPITNSINSIWNSINLLGSASNNNFDRQMKRKRTEEHGI